MSRTRGQEIVEKPCSRYLTWKTIKETKVIDKQEVDVIKGGFFTYYDSVKEERVTLDKMPPFAILDDTLVTFKGYNESLKQGVWSNEVRDKEHVVVLRNKQGSLIEFPLGDYKKVKDTVNGKAGKYVKSVYIAVNNEGTWEIWNLQLGGSQLTGGGDPKSKDPDDKELGWFNFMNNVVKGKKNRVFIELDKFVMRKKGASKYTVPKFIIGDDISEEEGKILDGLDEQLQSYLDWYFSKPKEETKEEEIHDDVSDSDWEDLVD
jgi:hypothetical protein